MVFFLQVDAIKWLNRMNRRNHKNIHTKATFYFDRYAHDIRDSRPYQNVTHEYTSHSMLIASML